MDLTFLELHLHDAEFNAPFAAGRSATDDDAEGSAAPSRPEAGELGTRLGPAAVLAAFAVLALLARYLRGGEADQTTLDEVEA